MHITRLFIQLNKFRTSLLILCFMFFAMSALDCTHYTVREYIRYAYDNNLVMPQRVEQLKAYLNTNEYGFSFDPIDPISTAFMCDVMDHRNNFLDTYVLEVGCGLGLLARKIIETPAKKNVFAYVGLDLSKENLAIATREIIEGITPDLIDIWQPAIGKFPDVELGAERFTHIGVFYVAHFWTPDECINSLQKIEKLLVRGGKAYIYTSHPYTSAYGPASRVLYDTNTGTFPGFIEDAPTYFNNLVQKGATSSMFKMDYVPHFLYLKDEELCDLVLLHTRLKIDYSCTINEHRAGVQKTFAGIILRK